MRITPLKHQLQEALHRNTSSILSNKLFTPLRDSDFLCCLLSCSRRPNTAGSPKHPIPTTTTTSLSDYMSSQTPSNEASLYCEKLKAMKTRTDDGLDTSNTTAKDIDQSIIEKRKNEIDTLLDAITLLGTYRGLADIS